jgi:hypothetical protein
VLTAEQASRFVAISLDCLHREYPNVTLHVMHDVGDVLSPRQMKPAFFGCLDWHSAVHNHWALLRLRRYFPDADWVPGVEAALDRSFTAENIAGELAYLGHPARTGFEMPYGMAWLLQLMAELHESAGDPHCERWRDILEPLETLASGRFASWLDRLPGPIRTGEHSQSAFAMGLARDWSMRTGAAPLRELIDARARDFHFDDGPWPFRLEPSAYDFLSPGLGIADLMRRVLPRAEFADWLSAFLGLETAMPERFPLAVVSCVDPSSGKLSHWEGLNLSRAWMLDAIAEDSGDLSCRDALRIAADEHRLAGLLSVTGEHYAGAHWLVSFAVYLTTQRWRIPT